MRLNCAQVHSWDAQACETHSQYKWLQTDTQRQTVSVCKANWSLLCTLDSGQHTAQRWGDMKHTPPHTAITCPRSYILLDIESFSQLAPKNKQSSVCPCRRAGAVTGSLTGVNRQPRKMFKLGGTHWKAAPFARSAGDVQRTPLAFSPSHFLLCRLWTVTVSVYMLLWLSARHSELPPPSELLYRALLKRIKLDFSTHSCKWRVYWVETCSSHFHSDPTINHLPLRWFKLHLGLH